MMTLTEIQAWFEMGGHGFFVWMAYGVGLGSMLAFFLWARHLYQLNLERVVKQLKRNSCSEDLAQKGNF